MTALEACDNCIHGELCNLKGTFQKFIKDVEAIEADPNYIEMGIQCTKYLGKVSIDQKQIKGKLSNHYMGWQQPKYDKKGEMVGYKTVMGGNEGSDI